MATFFLLNLKIKISQSNEKNLFKYFTYYSLITAKL